MRLLQLILVEVPHRHGVALGVRGQHLVRDASVAPEDDEAAAAGRERNPSGNVMAMLTWSADAPAALAGSEGACRCTISR